MTACKKCRKPLIGDDLKFKNCTPCRKIINDAKKLDQLHRPEIYEHRLELMRLNMIKRRTEPEFRKKELDYQIEYCNKRGITLNDLRGEIFVQL